MRIPTRQDLIVIPADPPGRKPIGWTTHETVGTMVANPRALPAGEMLELVLGAWKLMAWCSGGCAVLHLAPSDEAAARMGLKPASPLQPGRQAAAPSWQLCRLSRGCFVVTEPVREPGAMYASRLVAREPDWLWRMACCEVQDAVDPRSGKVLPSERSVLTGPEKLPGRDWPEWGQFSDRVDSTLDMLEVMSS